MLVRRILIAAIAVLAVTGAATAEPTMSLTWTSTTGSGTPGGNTIVAEPGNVLRLLVSAVAGPGGLTFASVSVGWDAGDLTGSNAAECPAPENMNSPVCTDGGTGPDPPGMEPFVPGVDIDNGAGSASSFDAGGITPFYDSIVVGAIEFEVEQSATTETLNVFYVPGIDSVNGGTGSVFYPEGSAYVVIPEPGDADLIRVGLGALGILGRRRRRAPSRSP